MDGDISMKWFSDKRATEQSFSYPPNSFCIPVCTIDPEQQKQFQFYRNVSWLLEKNINSAQK
jgi:hypothetical protein